MAKESAGILLYRQRGSALEVFLIHPGGPFWKNKDAGAWSIPKGEANSGEERLAAAIREFAEETGAAASDHNKDIRRCADHCRGRRCRCCSRSRRTSL